MNETPLYYDSFRSAKNNSEVREWRDSLGANIECKKAIDEAIRECFDGAHLSEDCAKRVIDEFGYKRTRYVLINTMQEKYDDGRFSRLNRSWASELFIPQDKQHNYLFCCEAHPAILDGFIDQFREAYNALDLFGRDKLRARGWEESLVGKVLVLKPGLLKESCLCRENQLWLATGGFGCEPHASGRAIFAECIYDGEECRWSREDFLGILDDRFLPDWAKEKLEPTDSPKAEPEMKM